MRGEIVQHLQVSHGVEGSKGMTEGAAGSMEPTLLPVPKKSQVIKVTCWMQSLGAEALEQDPHLHVRSPCVVPVSDEAIKTRGEES